MDKQNLLGQHFLNSDDVLNKIIQFANIRKDDIILEIGPGDGRLTKKLISFTKKVIVVEKDKDLISNLKQIKNLNVIHGNILDVIESLCFNKVVANIPYNISEPLIKKILRVDIDLLVLLIGKKFWNIINSNTKISNMINCFFSISLIREVPGNLFIPKTRVKSVLVRFDKINEKSLSSQNLILREIILQNDKKIKNALRDSLMKIYGMKKKDAVDKIILLNLPENILNKGIFAISNLNFELLYSRLNFKI